MVPSWLWMTCSVWSAVREPARLPELLPWSCGLRPMLSPSSNLVDPLPVATVGLLARGIEFFRYPSGSDQHTERRAIDRREARLEHAVDR
jgi:hypothetical protein